MSLFKKKPKLQWRSLASKGCLKRPFYRTPVPGGWLISSAEGESITFMPDREHRWNGESLPLIDD